MGWKSNKLWILCVVWSKGWVLRVVLVERLNKEPILICLVGVLEYFNKEKRSLRNLDMVLNPSGLIDQHMSDIV